MTERNTQIRVSQIKNIISDKIETNIVLNAFRIQVNGSLAQYAMVDGIVDEFEDESGIDTINSLNEDYNSTDDLYKPISTASPVLMLHCNGSDGSTTFTDDSDSGHTVTANGDAQLDTAQKKFGTASGLFDGTGDYLTIPDSSDWDIFASNTDDWTIDFFVRHTDHSGVENYISQYEDINNRWAIFHNDGNGIQLYVYTNATEIIKTPYGGEITDSNWHHVAMCKVGDEYAIYLDGNQVSYVQDSSTDTLSGSINIGRRGNNDRFFDGHMDEIRIIHSNAFNASPNVGLTDTITVPTSEHDDSGIFSDMTLISNSFIAEATPDTARIVIFEEDVDAITINTDLKAYVTRDGGSTYAEVTLSDVGDYETGKRILTGVVDLTQSGIGSGTSMEYKITTHNNKNLKLHGVGLHWA